MTVAGDNVPSLPPPPPPPTPDVWPKRLWVLLLVTGIVGPFVVWLFLSAMSYEGPGDAGGMAAMSGVFIAFDLAIVWLIALGTRLRRLVQRRSLGTVLPPTNPQIGT